MHTTLIWNGHSNFTITNTRCTVYIDPLFRRNPSCSDALWSNLPNPDVILVSHLHDDHLGDTIEICLQTRCKVGASSENAEELIRMGLPPERLLRGTNFDIGCTTVEKGAHITLTEAAHQTDHGTANGFIIDMANGTTIYHAGDTDLFANMALIGKLYSLDIALLPIGGLATMDARMAAMAARMLRARKVVPMHWGHSPRLAQNTEEFRQELKKYAPGCKMVDTQPGKRLRAGSKGI